MIQATRGFLVVDAATDTNLDLMLEPDGQVSTLLCLNQNDPSENGIYLSVVEDDARRWERVQWTGAPQVLVGRIVAVWIGNSLEGLYKLPDAAGITWGMTAIHVERV